MRFSSSACRSRITGKSWGPYKRSLHSRKPTSALLLNQSLKWLVSARERLRRMEEKATSVEEKMEEIRLVNRAKWLLIEQLKMTEAEAHRHIEKQAMDRCTTRQEIALGIIKTYA